MRSNDSRLSVLIPSTALYLTLPAFLFAFGWLRMPFAAITLLLLGIFAWVSLNDLYRSLRAAAQTYRSWLVRPHSKKVLAYIFVGLSLITVWLFFSGVAGFGFQNQDYRASNALFKDLIFQTWPTTVSIDAIQGRVVYYLAYYLPAALLGKSFGWDFANLALFAWTWLGIVLCFFWFLRLTRIDLSTKPGIILGITFIFCLAGGLDLFGLSFLRNDQFRFSNENEWWAGFFQYSSNTSLIYWVPQQAIAAWLITGLVGETYYEAAGWKYVGLTVASSVIWSPFGVLGAAPFLILSLIHCFFSPACNYLLNRWVLLLNFLSLWIAGVHILYIGANQFQFPIGFIWQMAEDQGRYLNYLLAFWFLEFALLGGLTLALIRLGIQARPSKPGSSDFSSLRLNWMERITQEFKIAPPQVYLFSISLIVLFVLPLFSIGIYNDLVMRASIPSLFIFWSFIAKVLADASLRVRIRQNFLYALILSVLIIGFYPAILGISDSFLKYHFGPPELSSVATTGEANARQIVLQRIGDPNSFFYRYIGR